MVDAVVVMAVVCVMVLVGAVIVVVVWAGVDAVSVRVGASGARFSRMTPAARMLRSRFALAAAIRLRAYSTSTARSLTAYLRMRGMVVGVTKAAGWSLVGLYVQGLSLFEVGIVQVAVTVFVV